LSGLLLTTCLSVQAQQPERISRIGYLPSAGAPIPRQFKAFPEALRDLGYVEGKNIVIEKKASSYGESRTQSLGLLKVCQTKEILF
jgi:hypothetical protein